MAACPRQSWSPADGSVSSLVRVIVLGEDERHQRFIRRYLHRLGYESRDIRAVTAPSGRGSAEQWVRQQYSAEVREYRRRSARKAFALIVAIDADVDDVDRRTRQLRVALEQAGLTARAADESIVHLIPKRNVETWILCLSGRQVDEATDYKRDENVDRLIKPAALTFFEWSRLNFVTPPHSVPSLSVAVPEVRRLG